MGFARSDRRVHAAVVPAEGHSGAEPEHPPPWGVREAAWVVTPASYWAKWGAHSGLAGMTLAATGAEGFVALAYRAVIKQIR